MNRLVLSVLAALAAAGGGGAVSPQYGAPPVYSRKSNLQSRRRPFQSALRPVPPYGAPHEAYLKRPYGDYPLKPYGHPSRLPGGVYSQSPYRLASVGPNGGLLGPLFGDYPDLPYGDYPKLPYGNYPKLPYGGYPSLPIGLYPPPPHSGPPAPLLNVYPNSPSGKYLKPLIKDTVPVPFYPTKYPKKYKNYLKPLAGAYPKRNATTTRRPYSFSYGLVDVRGNDFGAAEESDGREVQGQYSVLLPDGRLQTVTYSVEGDSGFVADVTYEGEAKFVDEDGEEEGRSTVRRGRGPIGG